jgi:hypothetical protein
VLLLLLLLNTAAAATAAITTAATTTAAAAGCTLQCCCCCQLLCFTAQELRHLTITSGLSNLRSRAAPLVYCKQVTASFDHMTQQSQFAALSRRNPVQSSLERVRGPRVRVQACI